MVRITYHDGFTQKNDDTASNNRGKIIRKNKKIDREIVPWNIVQLGLKIEKKEIFQLTTTINGKLHAHPQSKLMG